MHVYMYVRIYQCTYLYNIFLFYVRYLTYRWIFQMYTYCLYPLLQIIEKNWERTLCKAISSDQPLFDFNHVRLFSFFFLYRHKGFSFGGHTSSGSSDDHRHGRPEAVHVAEAGSEALEVSSFTVGNHRGAGNQGHFRLALAPSLVVRPRTTLEHWPRDFLFHTLHAAIRVTRREWLWYLATVCIATR